MADKIEQLSKQLRTVGMVLLGLGGGALLLGLGGLYHFHTRYALRAEVVTGDQMGRAAAFPHIAVVLGFGFCVFGLVLVRRGHSLPRDR